MDSGPARFATTRWSIVLAAVSQPTAESRVALTSLCRQYWSPLYSYTRRRGHSKDDAADVVQGFFARIIEKGDLEAVDPVRGRFRSWLIASLKHYLANASDRANAQKRGGGVEPLSFDLEAAEHSYLAAPAELSPDQLYERKWVLSVLESSLRELEASYVARGRGGLFEALKPMLVSDDTVPYVVIAERFAMNENAVKQAAHQLKNRFVRLVRARVADTVERPEDRDEELKGFPGLVA